MCRVASQRSFPFHCDHLRCCAFRLHTKKTQRHNSTNIITITCHFSLQKGQMSVFWLLDVFCTYFLRIGDFEHCILNKSLQIWVGKKSPLTKNCGAAVYICHWWQKNKLFGNPCLPISVLVTLFICDNMAEKNLVYFHIQYTVWACFSNNTLMQNEKFS